MDAIFAVAGVMGFEGIRIYKRTVSGQNPIPTWRGPYFIGISLVSLFSFVVCWAAGVGSSLESLFVGFSIPANGKVIFSNSETGVKHGEVSVDDVEIVDRPTSRGYTQGMRDKFVWFWNA